MSCLGQIKNTLFKVIRLYQNVLMKPRFFQVFLKNYNLMHFEGEMPFKMHKIIFFPEKTICVPTPPRIYRPVTRNTLFFFLFGVIRKHHSACCEFPS